MDNQHAKEQSDSSTLRAFALLELIASASSLSLNELTQASGLPKPTVFRILGLLGRSGLVCREPLEKRYVVGPRLSSMALNVQLNSTQRARRRAILAQLVEEIGETCNFTMLDGDKVIYLDRVETASPVRLHMEPGSRVPLHCTASGKLFLAHLGHGELRKMLGPGPLERYTARTITNMDVLERELERIRSEGIGTDVGEYLKESVCLAVPVSDLKGRVCAAVAVHGPAPRMTLERGATFVPALKRAAEAIGATFDSDGIGRDSPTTPSRRTIRVTRSPRSTARP